MTRERRLTAVLVATLGVILVAGLGAAFAIGRAQHGGAATAGTGVVTTRTTPTAAPPATTGTAGTLSGPVSTRPGPVSTRSGPVSSPDTAVPAAGVEVALSAEAQSSRYADQVRSLLQRYFDAINAHDYRAWSESVTAAQSAHWAEQDWQGAYASTADSDIYVSDITEGAPLTVRIQFVSHQDVELAPTSLPVTCINWDVIYRLEPSDSGLRVGTSARDPYLVRCR
jgi:hypothetical protein